MVTDQNEDPVPTVWPDDASHKTNSLGSRVSEHQLATTVHVKLTYARIPPNAPARAAPLKNREILNCLSLRLYHLQIVSALPAPDDEQHSKHDRKTHMLK